MERSSEDLFKRKMHTGSRSKKADVILDNRLELVVRDHFFSRDPGIREAGYIQHQC